MVQAVETGTPMLRYIAHLFTTPSAQLTDWRAFAVNQSGHGAVGIVAASIIGWWALALYAVWEAAQYAWSRRPDIVFGDAEPATLSDCAYDWCFVATGVIAVMLDSWSPIGLQAVLILAGVAERRGL